MIFAVLSEIHYDVVINHTEVNIGRSILQNMTEIISLNARASDAYFVFSASDEEGAFAIVGDPPDNLSAEISLAAFRHLNAAYAEAATPLEAVNVAMVAWEAWKQEGRQYLCYEAGRRVLLLGQAHDHDRI